MKWTIRHSSSKKYICTLVLTLRSHGPVTMHLRRPSGKKYICMYSSYVCTLVLTLRFLRPVNLHLRHSSSKKVHMYIGTHLETYGPVNLHLRHSSSKKYICTLVFTLRPMDRLTCTYVIPPEKCTYYVQCTLVLTLRFLVPVTMYLQSV